MEEPSCYLKHSTRGRQKTPKCMERLVVPYMARTCKMRFVCLRKRNDIQIKKLLIRRSGTITQGLSARSEVKDSSVAKASEKGQCTCCTFTPQMIALHDKLNLLDKAGSQVDKGRAWRHELELALSASIALPQNE